MTHSTNSPAEPEHRTTSTPLGVLVNPASGRDARRLFARAGSSTLESKRNQVERILVGAASSGATRALLVRDPLRISDGAIEALGVELEIELHDIAASLKPSDTATAIAWMRDQGCGAISVLGGDGTNRILARTWPEAPILPISTGTNNVFPLRVEATIAGAAAGAIAAGIVPLEEAARRTKVVRAKIEGEEADLGLIDAVHLTDDHTGNLLPFEPAKIRTLVLARALPDAVGMSPIGGMLEPCTSDDEFGVVVECAPAREGQYRLLAPISPGLYRQIDIRSVRRLKLGERVAITGPGLLAFDGDRERDLATGQKAWLWVERTGPFVIEPARALGYAASQGIYLNRAHWHDHRDGKGFECC